MPPRPARCKPARCVVQSASSSSHASSTCDARAQNFARVACLPILPNCLKGLFSAVSQPIFASEFYWIILNIRFAAFSRSTRSAHFFTAPNAKINEKCISRSALFVKCQSTFCKSYNVLPTSFEHESIFKIQLYVPYNVGKNPFTSLSITSRGKKKMKKHTSGKLNQTFEFTENWIWEIIMRKPAHPSFQAPLRCCGLLVF